jgi:hypothetical protein
VAAEVDAVFDDLADLGEAEDLESAAVGEDGQGPVHEAVEAAGGGQDLESGPDEEMVGVAQDDLGAGFEEFRGSMALTEAWVPTGMKTGVSMTPWAVVSRPRRALVPGSVASSSNIRPDDATGGRGFARISWIEFRTLGRDRGRRSRIHEST